MPRPKGRFAKELSCTFPKLKLGSGNLKVFTAIELDLERLLSPYDVPMKWGGREEDLAGNQNRAYWKSLGSIDGQETPPELILRFESTSRTSTVRAAAVIKRYVEKHKGIFKDSNKGFGILPSEKGDEE